MDTSRDEFLRARRKAGQHAGDTGNPHNVTKQQTGLGNLTNDKQIPYTGWTALPVCTYSGTSAFTIEGDQSGMIQKWDKIKLTNGTVKYFYAASVSYNAGTGLTTVTAAGCGLYALAGGSISFPYCSKVETPQGWPEEINMYGQHPMRCVYFERVSGSAKTSVAISQDVLGADLSAVNALEYILLIRIKNTSAGNCDYQIRINGDASNAGYYSVRLSYGKVSSNVYDDYGYIAFAYAGGTCSSKVSIGLIDADLQVDGSGLWGSETEANLANYKPLVAKVNGAGADITRIEITASTANAIGVGSEISLWSLSGR